MKDRYATSDSYKESKSTYDNAKYDYTEDERLRKILQSIILFEGINIEIIGCWIWVDGNTFRYKDDLKAIGFKWANEKKKWYFHTEAFKKRSKRTLSIDDIRNLYGSTEVKMKEKPLLQA